MGIRTSSDIMLDGLDRMDGGQGGGIERSAWLMLACASNDWTTVRQAANQANKLGADWESLAAKALSCDAPLAMRACVQDGKLLESSNIGDNGFNRLCAKNAIDNGAVRCLDELLALGWSNKSLNPGTYGGEQPRSWIALAAVDQRAGVLEHLLARHRWTSDDLQEALSMSASMLGERNDTHVPSSERAKSRRKASHEDIMGMIMAAGADWRAPATEQRWGEDLGSYATLGHLVASKRFVIPKRTNWNNGMVDSSIKKAWGMMVASSADWGLQGGPGHELAVHCARMPGFGRADWELAWSQYPDMFASPATWDWLLESTQARLMAVMEKDEPLEPMIFAMEKFKNGALPSMSEAQTGAWASMALGGDAKRLPYGRLAENRAACVRIAAECSDVERARDLCKQVASMLEEPVAPGQVADAQTVSKREALMMSLSCLGAVESSKRPGARL